MKTAEWTEISNTLYTRVQKGEITPLQFRETLEEWFQIFTLYAMNQT